jgi:glycosyltransferase involved in cell wall biosynthesis
MKNILVVADSINVNDSSGSKANVAFINSLNKAGSQVTVLHYSQKEIKLPGINCILVNEKKSTALYILSRIQRVLFRWFHLDISKYTNSVFGFSFGFFNDVFSLSKALKSFNPVDFEMLWTFGKGTSFRAHAALLKNANWFPLWYAYVHDPYPQHLYPRPYNFVEYGFKKKRYFFRDITIKAHRLVFPSLLLKEWMQSYFLHVEGKSLIIPHQLQTTVSNLNCLPSYFDATKFNLLHAGNLLDLRNPKPIVEAYENFLAEIPQAKKDSTLLFFGYKSIYQNFLMEKKKELPQLYISDGYVNFEDVFAMQQQASVNVIIEATSEISPFLPGKFPHCVAADKPILVVGPYYSECKRLLGKDYPYLFDFKKVDEIKNAIKILYLNWKERKVDCQLNRPDLMHYLSSNYLIQVLENDNKYLQ